MLVCQCNTDLQLSTDSQQDVNWTLAAQSYPNMEEAPSFIAQQRQAAGEHTFTTYANPRNLLGKQLQVYTSVQQHYKYKAVNPPPLRMIGQARLVLESHTSFIVCDFFSSTSSMLQHQLVWPPSMWMVTHCTPSSVYPLEVTSKTWRQSD